MYLEARVGRLLNSSVRKKTSYLLRITQSLNNYIFLRTHKVEEAIPPLIVR